MAMKRTNVYADPEDLELIKKGAERLGVPEAEIIRRGIHMAALSVQTWDTPAVSRKFRGSGKTVTRDQVRRAVAGEAPESGSGNDATVPAVDAAIRDGWLAAVVERGRSVREGISGRDLWLDALHRRPLDEASSAALGLVAVLEEAHACRATDAAQVRREQRRALLEFLNGRRAPSEETVRGLVEMLAEAAEDAVASRGGTQA
ncbi:hypothetical protein ACWC0C_07130 [Streptomyces sp. NPDC001709]